MGCCRSPIARKTLIMRTRRRSGHRNEYWRFEKLRSREVLMSMATELSARSQVHANLVFACIGNYRRIFAMTSSFYYLMSLTSLLG